MVEFDSSENVYLTAAEIELRISEGVQGDFFGNSDPMDAVERLACLFAKGIF